MKKLELTEGKPIDYQSALIEIETIIESLILICLNENYIGIKPNVYHSISILEMLLSKIKDFNEGKTNQF